MNERTLKQRPEKDTIKLCSETKKNYFKSEDQQ